MKNFTKETMFGFIVGAMSIVMTIVISPLTIMAIREYSEISMNFEHSNYVVYGIMFIFSIGIMIEVTNSVFSMFIKNERIENLISVDNPNKNNEPVVNVNEIKKSQMIASSPMSYKNKK